MILLFIAVSTGNALDSHEVERLYSKARDFHTSGKLDEALEHYSKVIEVDGDHANALFYRARIFHNQNRYDLAILDYARVIELKPEFSSAHGWLGRLLLMKGEFLEARQFCQKAYDLSPKNFQFAANLGHTYFLTSDVKTARKYYRKSVERITSREELKRGPLRDFEIFMDKGWQVEACRLEMEVFEKEFQKNRRIRNHITYLYLSVFPLITLFFALPAYLVRRYEMRRLENPEKDKAVVLHGARRKLNFIFFCFFLCILIWVGILFGSDRDVLNFDFMIPIVKFLDSTLGKKAVVSLSVFFFLAILVAANIPGFLWIHHSYYRLEKAVRNTTWSFKTFSLILLRNHLVLILPFTLCFTLLPLLSDFLFIGSLLLLMVATGPLWVRLANHAEPLGDSQLAERIESLCKRAGIRPCPAYVMFMPGGKVVNAMFSGLFPFYRRIFITDTAIEQLTVEEMEAIVAHEIGHAKKRHLWKGLVFILIFLVLSLIFIFYLFDKFLESLLVALSAIPLLVVWMSEYPGLTSTLGMIVWILSYVGILGVVDGILSRHFEKEADIFAANLTGNKDAYLSMLEKLARLNHMPKRWGKTEIKQTHPSIQKRMDYIARL